MKKYQKKTVVIIITIILSLLSIMMTGCIKKNDKYKETEYFRYQVFTSDGEEMVSIKGLTEKGKQLKNIVIPEEIDGKKVNNYQGSDPAPNVRKIIVSYNVRTINSWGLTSATLFVHDYSYGPKIIYVNCRYIKSAVFGEVEGYYAVNAEKDYRRHFPDLKSLRFANIQYMFNYDDSPNEGVSFLDDLDIGEKLEIIPATPKRDGYMFTGWYAEPECINKVEMDGYVKMDEEIVYLYAGWEEKQ